MPHELARHGHIEATVRALGDRARPAKHLEGRGIHGDRMIERLAVDPAHVTFGVVEAHTAIDQRDLVERGVYDAMRLQSARVGRRDLEEGAEELPAALDGSA